MTKKKCANTNTYLPQKPICTVKKQCLSVFVDDYPINKMIRNVYDIDLPV